MEEKHICKTLDGLETIPLTKRQAKGIERTFRIATFSLLALLGAMTYQGAIEEYGSIKKALTHFTDKYPDKMFNVNF